MSRVDRLSGFLKNLRFACPLALLFWGSCTFFLLQDSARALPSDRAVYVAERDQLTGGVRIVLRSGEQAISPSTELASTRWHPFQLRGVSPHDPGQQGCVQEIDDSWLPRICVRGEFQIFSFSQTHEEGSGGIAVIGPRGVEVLLSSRDERYSVITGGAFLAPGGGFLGLLLKGKKVEELVILDLRGSWPVVHPVRLPENIEKIVKGSLTLTEDAAFFTAREDTEQEDEREEEDDEREWSVYYSPLESNTDSQVLLPDSKIAGPFEMVCTSMAHSRTAAAFLAGKDDDLLDWFVATGSGSAVNVTSDPGPYLEHDPDDPRMAISSDGGTVAYNLEWGNGEPEIYIHSVGTPGPGGRFQITADERFNPYIDQASLIFFSRAGLVFGAGHSVDSADIFRVDSRDWLTINLTHTGGDRTPPFTVTGNLLLRSAVVTSGDLLLVFADSSSPESSGSSLQLLSMTTGESMERIDSLAEIAGYISVGADLYFQALSKAGVWTLYRQRHETVSPVATATPGESPLLLLHDPENAFYFVPGTGLILLRADSEPRVLVPADEMSPHAALSESGGELLGGFRSSGEESYNYFLIDLASGVWTSVEELSEGSAVLAIGDALALFVRGDANGDGGVDISDPIRTLFYLFSGTTLPCLDAADSNDDGHVGISDAIYGLDAVFGEGSLFPPPHPGNGLDPTEDGLSCSVSP